MNAPEKTPAGIWKRITHVAVPFIGLAVFTLALYVLHNKLRDYRLSDIKRAIKEIPSARVLAAFGFTALSYFLLACNEALAFRYIKNPLGFRKILLSAFCTYSLNNNVSLGGIAGTSVRYRLYNEWGLSIIEIAKIIAFTALTIWLGFLTVGGFIFISMPLDLPFSIPFFHDTNRPIGVVFLAIVTAYVVSTLTRERPIKLWGWEFPVPTMRLFFLQLAIACADWAAAGASLYFLLPTHEQLSYPVILGIYMLAQTAGVLTHVPGGLGILESTVLTFLTANSEVSTPDVMGALVVFRTIYYWLPLVLGMASFAIHEVFLRRERVRKLAAAIADWAPDFIPAVFAFLTFTAGAVLLVSGATPSHERRLRLIADILSLPVMEVSHFLGSIVAIGLLMLARGLQRRLDAAYVLTAIMLCAGILLSLLKGFNYEEATLLTTMLVALLPCRAYFHRKTSLLNQAFTPGWIAAILLVLFGTIWLGLFSFRHVQYSSELWWQFELRGDAPRALRATVGAICLLSFLGLRRLLRPSPPEPTPPVGLELRKARNIVEQSNQTSGYLALLGDKGLLFNDKENGFIMYGTEGQSWVALGDPVGPKDEIPELIWRFREMCDRHGGWSVFYQVQPENLHYYLDLGLTFFKLGEEARVRLESFSLEGGDRRSQRHIVNRLEKEGFQFEVVPPAEVEKLMPELKIVSDAWLTGKNTREKGFSLGYFEPDYLKNFPAGIVRKDDKIVAFTNIWLTHNREELSVDLMRYDPSIQNGLMDFLFTRLMLWGKAEGYQWFNLGMAPLSGLENRALAPLWNRIGALVFRHGEHFYNFQGLRQYKEKFDPVWEPRYLASPTGLALPSILTNIGSLISGGVRGMFRK